MIYVFTHKLCLCLMLLLNMNTPCGLCVENIYFSPCGDNEDIKVPSDWVSDIVPLPFPDSLIACCI